MYMQKEKQKAKTQLIATVVQINTNIFASLVYSINSTMTMSQPYKQRS